MSISSPSTQTCLLPTAVNSVAFRCINFIIQIAQDACAQLQDAVRTGCFRLVLETQEEQTIVNGIAKVGFLAFLVCFLDSQKGQAVCLRIEALLAIGADDCALPNTTSYVKREERACRTKISLVCAGASLHLILQHKLEVRVDQVNQEAALSRAAHQDAGKRTALVLPSALT